LSGGKETAVLDSRRVREDKSVKRSIEVLTRVASLDVGRFDSSEAAVVYIVDSIVVLLAGGGIVVKAVDSALVLVTGCVAVNVGL
jgi:hypothetical protein